MARSHGVPLFYFAFLQVLSSSALPNGAPESACESMMPRHVGIQPDPNPAPYNFTVTANSFKNGQPINVVITGAPYRGLLLEARSFESTAAVGTWSNPPDNTKFLKCSGNAQGAMTHSNTEFKSNATVYTWMPPERACPSVITFMATVAESKAVYWVNLRSKVLYKDPTATCGAEMFTWGIVTLLLLISHVLFIHDYSNVSVLFSILG